MAPMEVIGRYELSAPKDVVLAALGDLELLASCIPGCESLERLAEDEAKAIVTVEIGEFTSRFSGSVKADPDQTPDQWHLRGEGRGRPAGSARGEVTFKLSDREGGTTVSVRGTVEIGGKLAKLDSDEVVSFSRALAEGFVDCLEAAIGARQSEWVDQLDHTPAGVPILGDEPGEDVVQDKAEIAGKAASEMEQRVEVAAAKDFLGGPVVWGLLAFVALIVAIMLAYQVR